jgi:excinuclease UvrABC nuclease subunit
MDFDIDIVSMRFKEEDGNSRSKSEEAYHALEGVRWKQGGVYFIYRDGVLLYVGRSINLKQRLMSHVLRSSPATAEYVNEATNIKGFFVWDIADQEIYETYAIKTLKPKLNKQKTHKIKRNYGAADNREVIVDE